MVVAMAIGHGIRARRNAGLEVRHLALVQTPIERDSQGLESQHEQRRQHQQLWASFGELTERSHGAQIKQWPLAVKLYWRKR
jgi:hypothetical protein